MQQRTAFVWAGVITASVTATVVLTTGMFGVLPAQAVTPAATMAATGSESSRQVAGAEIRQSIADLDTQLRPQLQKLQEQVEQLAATAEQKQQSLNSLQSKLAATQAAIARDDQGYAQQASELQAQDAQARVVLEEAAAELRAVYAQLGVQVPQLFDNSTAQGWAEDEHEERAEHEGHDDD